MRKLFFVLNIILLLSLVLTACKPTPTPTPTKVVPEVIETEEPEPEIVLPDLAGKVINIAVENAYLPFNYINLETGEAEGWDYDFINEACARLNCVPNWIEFGWDTMIAAVGDGQFDMAADGITITEERAKQVDFSEGYVAIEQRLLVRIDETRFEGPDDFAANPELILGEQVNTTNYLAAVELVGEERVITFDDFGMTVQALIAGDVDGVIIDEVAGLGYLGANKDQLKLIGRSVSSDMLGFVFPKGSDLVAAFNAVIAQMKKDGFLEQINQKWFGPSFVLTYDDVGAGAYGVDPLEIGGSLHPIKVLFVPSVDVDFMIASGDLLEQALNEATGLYFEVSIPTSYAATIEEMCASPDDSIGFIPAMGYALANSLCGVEPGLASVRYGWNVYFTAFFVARDSEFQTIYDADGKVDVGATLQQLEGASWGYPDVASTSGYAYPMSLFMAYGVNLGETVETGGHPQAVRAVYNDEVDVGTAFYSPMLLPGGVQWQIGDPPDPPDEVIPECGLNEEGKLYCGEYRILDARQVIREEAPDVVQQVRILVLSPEIPNDTMSFSPNFPADLKDLIMDAVIAYVATDACKETLCNENFYEWTGAARIYPENFDGVFIMMEQLGITLDTIGG
ncbi:MAG: transporter substrate-binding domain-containing protein [Chloroflexota bacterium]